MAVEEVRYFGNIANILHDRTFEVNDLSVVEIIGMS